MNEGTARTARLGGGAGGPFLISASRPLRLLESTQSSRRCPSSVQCSATFLLGCTRGGSPGIFG